MNILHRLSVLALVVVASFSGPLSRVRAASVLVDIKTVTTRVTRTSDSPIATRLFLDSGATQPAPLGTPLWFIVDLARNGLGLEDFGRQNLLASELLGNDDVVVLRDFVDGGQPGDVPGRFLRNGVSLTIPEGRTEDEFLAGNVYAVLWNDPASGAEPAVGTRFGILNLGANAKPTIGNPFWSITENLFASTFQIVPVPEPGLLGWAGAAGLVAWGAWRRLRRGFSFLR